MSDSKLKRRTILAIKIAIFSAIGGAILGAIGGGLMGAFVGADFFGTGRVLRGTFRGGVGHQALVGAGSFAMILAIIGVIHGAIVGWIAGGRDE
ncbi:MAG: hypothetical protein FJY39_05855 [Betaproteobacteria bacterium]|nr:hypothetical protein [Betaproteobacteria bacterium]MBM4210031.1 hypothetical protein [Gammaproteobacteria bacterium]